MTQDCYSCENYRLFKDTCAVFYKTIGKYPDSNLNFKCPHWTQRTCKPNIMVN
jgi:hypothetical protein